MIAAREIAEQNAYPIERQRQLRRAADLPAKAWSRFSEVRRALERFRF